MASLESHHKELDKDGIGKCSCPQFWGWGGDAGFCDKPAYGNQTAAYVDGFKYVDPRVRRAAYCPGLACPEHGGPKFRVFMDGDAFCAVHPDFVNLQESHSGFGATKEEAVANLYLVPT